MSQDAKDSLILVGSVTLFFGLFWLFLELSKRFDIPEIPTWLLAIGLIFATIDFGRLITGLWKRRYRPGRTEKAGDA